MAKKIIVWIILVIVLATTIFLLINNIDKSEPLYVAHRGYSSKYPGNTAKDKEKAAEMPFYGIETDIRETVDGVFVCNHDRDVEFYDGTKRPVNGSKYSELMAKPLKNTVTSDEIYICKFDEYLDICKKIRDRVENVTITSDFIVGFPGETQEQFEETLSVIDEAELDYSNTAAYSPRRQTPAATWKDRFIPDEIKKERLRILNDKVKASSKISNEKYIGKTLEVLVDEHDNKNPTNIMSGRTRNNKVIHFEGDNSLIGTLVNVKMNEALDWCLKGEISK